MYTRDGAPIQGKPLDSSFDFLTSAEAEPIPVHEVEIRMAEHRRRGNVARDVSQHKFAAMLGITLNDTRDPVTSGSCLDTSEAYRSYYGDPEDEVYRKFKKGMDQFISSDRWLKGKSFLQEEVLKDFVLLKTFENDALEHLEEGDEDAILEVEEDVYASVRSEAHRKNLHRYRETHSPGVLALRLSFERCRRAANALRHRDTYESQCSTSNKLGF